MNETVLITGASSGIGRETALKFAKEGHFVIALANKNSEGLDTLKEEIQSKNGRIITALKNVAQFDEISDLFNELAKQGIFPDIIINNAAISYVGLLQDMTSEEWQDTINTNLSSAFNTSKLALPHMISNKSGRIINISSMWGIVGASCEVAYSASKGGINTFTKALAKELAPSGIAVNAIAFGVVNTRMNSFLSTEEKDELISEIPAGRMLEPKEAAEIIYSVANLNSYVTGQIISADGGYI